MAKRGRKSGFNESLRSRIIALAEKGKTLAQVADIIGVSKQTIYNWFGHHKDLLYAVRNARQIADELVEASLFQRATGYSHSEEKVFQYEGGIVTHDTMKHYPPDTTAAMFWLRNRQPKRWREKTEGDVNVNLNTLSEEQIDARIKALQAKGAKK